MINNRFTSDLMTMPDRVAAPLPSSAFLVVSVPADQGAQTSCLASLYQQIYERAVQAHQKPKVVRDLFAIMN